jgi:hypothetical protein
MLLRINMILLLIVTLNFIEISNAADTVRNFETWTTKQANKDLSIAPSGTGQVNVGGDGLVHSSKTTGQITAIASPTEGQVVYDSTLKKIYAYLNSIWTDITGGGATREQNIMVNSDFYYSRRGTTFGMGAGTSTRGVEGWHCRTGAGAGSTVTHQTSGSDFPGGPTFMAYNRDGTSDLAQCGQGLLYKDFKHVLGVPSTITIRAQRRANTTASNRFKLTVYYTTGENNFGINFGGGGAISAFTQAFGFGDGTYHTFSHTFTLPTTARTVWVEIGDDSSGNVNDGYNVNWIQWHRGSTAQVYESKFASQAMAFEEVQSRLMQLHQFVCVATNAVSMHCAGVHSTATIRDSIAYFQKGTMTMTDNYASDRTQSAAGSVTIAGGADAPTGTRFVLNNFSGMTAGRVHFTSDAQGDSVLFDADF